MVIIQRVAEADSTYTYQIFLFLYYFADILVNGVAESIDFSAYPEGKPYTMVIIQRVTEADSTYTYQMLFAAGFTINVYPISGLLSLSVAITGEWYNQLTGKGITANYFREWLNKTYLSY